MEDTRFIVGIDLGTTNSAAFFVDTRGDGGPEHFAVPQVVAPGEVAAVPLLPSFCYLPAGQELPPGALALPWAAAPARAVGSFARDQGARVPGRLIASAKSWLAHAGVDRTRPILPWGAELGEAMLSPVAVSALVLGHLRDAWDHRFAATSDTQGNPCRLDTQQVIVTVPASFDETARELTIAAAREAGLRRLTLLEEPQAAFYAWLARHADDWGARLRPGERVLVVDVGGGTTDFSVITVDAGGTLRRSAVGEHLLLGGDNMDMAIARHLEGVWQARLGPGEWAMLCQLARRAKEELLTGAAASTDVTLLGAGSAVVRGVRRATLARATVESLILDGFYPLVPVAAAGPQRAGGIRRMGLPYAREPAVTLHLLQFLRQAARLAGEPGDGPLYPAAVLFNGGSVKPAAVRARVLQTLAAWFPDRPPPRELDGADYDLAVARGAAYYGLVRRGRGVRVRGGMARTCYVAAAAAAGTSLVCVMPRDTQENEPVQVPGAFRARANDAVVFRLFSSATRLGDRPGDVLPPGDDTGEVAPLAAVLRYGKGESLDLDVRLECVLTEVGALELAVQSLRTEHRWPLRFDLRPGGGEGPAPAAVVVEAGATAAALAVLDAACAGDAAGLARLGTALEEALGLPRDDWGLAVLRQLADRLAALAPARQRAAEIEARWLNLAGYCLRPGFGDPGDELRLRQAWKWWTAGPLHPRQPQVAAEWWVFWRRLAPGLAFGPQQQVGAAATRLVCPRGVFRERLKEGEQVRREAWRCLGALELLAADQRLRLGAAIVANLHRADREEYWALARFGARRAFHAPLDSRLPGAAVAPWLEALLAQTGPDPGRMRAFALSRLAAHTGDRHLDPPPDLLDRVRTRLLADAAPDTWIAHLDGGDHDSADERTRLLGDSLPLGLHLVPP